MAELLVEKGRGKEVKVLSSKLARLWGRMVVERMQMSAKPRGVEVGVAIQISNLDSDSSLELSTVTRKGWWRVAKEYLY